MGGGTAGSIVAGRLSEKFNVLLLESGGHPVPIVANPFLRQYVGVHPAINNIFTSVPQDHFYQESGGVSLSVFGTDVRTLIRFSNKTLFKKKIVKTHTGRMLGGSGSHNGNFYNRGSSYDYNYFANVTEDESWSYKNALNHFKNFERYVGKLINESERAGVKKPLRLYFNSDI